MGEEDNKIKAAENSKRQLTEKEKQRLVKFAATEEELKNKGYTRKDLTISLTKANVVGMLLVLPIMAVLCIVFLAFHGLTPIKDLIETHDLWTGLSIVLAGISIVPLAVIHELIHGLTWGIGAKNHMKDIEYGFIKEMLTPYCYCRSPLSKGMYLIGSLMPMTLLGTVVCIFGIIFASPALMLTGLLQVMGGSGDILVSSMLLRYNTKGKDVVLMDHPTECGLIVFEK
ncbi:MAG: DUF3267 domain-containing protein [Clostridiales bacterium]|jgi:hypothetical protein|nr:DUF3267 domain-containing protein [Clostridiales bacterium]